MFSILNFISESFDELTNRVSWPSYEKVQELLTLFVIGVIIVTLIVGLVNISLAKITKWGYAYF